MCRLQPNVADAIVPALDLAPDFSIIENQSPGLSIELKRCPRVLGRLRDLIKQ
jgi:hypothetical protein